MSCNEDQLSQQNSHLEGLRTWFSSWASNQDDHATWNSRNARTQPIDQNLQEQYVSVDTSIERLLGRDFSASRLDEYLNSPEGNSSHFSSGLSRIQQLESWDCGIACLLIILRWARDDGNLTRQCGPSSSMCDVESQQYRHLRKAIDTESIWTADLVYQLDSLLKGTSVRYLYCSKAFEVHKEYEDVGYYQDAFRKDEQRVTSIFARLKSNLQANMECVPQGMSLHVVLNAVSHSNCIAVALIDNSVLWRKLPLSLSSHETWYVGHYVILCGVSCDPDHLREAREFAIGENDATIEEERNAQFCIVLCDPGQHSPAFSFVMPDRFERSWRARGTDEDIIFFSKSTV